MHRLDVGSQENVIYLGITDCKFYCINRVDIMTSYTDSLFDFMQINTIQLVVIWYAGLAVSLVLFSADPDSTTVSVLFNTTGIIILAGTLIYSLRPHPEVSKRVVAVSVFIPSLLVAVLLWYSNRPDPGIVVSNDDVEVFDMDLNFIQINEPLVVAGPFWMLKGRVRNNSEYRISSFEVRLDVYRNGRLVDGDVSTVEFDSSPIPPSAVRTFKTTFGRLGPQQEFEPSYSILRVTPAN